MVQKVTNVHQKKGMNMMKVNETHIHVVYGKIKVLHYFRFAAEGLIFFLTISISYALGKVCRNLVYCTFYSCNKLFSGTKRPSCFRDICDE